MHLNPPGLTKAMNFVKLNLYVEFYAAAQSIGDVSVMATTPKQQ
jgi:hypothetical protein